MIVVFVMVCVLVCWSERVVAARNGRFEFSRDPRAPQLTHVNDTCNQADTTPSKQRKEERRGEEGLNGCVEHSNDVRQCMAGTKNIASTSTIMHCADQERRGGLAGVPVTGRNRTTRRVGADTGRVAEVALNPSLIVASLMFRLVISSIC